MTAGICGTTLSGMDPQFQATEALFNKLGHYPVVSFVSGSCRMTYGGMQAWVSLLLAVKLLAESRIFPETKNDSIRESKGQLLYTCHGLANIGRGSVEMLFIIGNVLTIIYDYSRVRFKYSGEAGSMNEANFSLDDIQEFFRKIEGILNQLGHIPFVSRCSGALRVQLGTFQMMMSLLLAAVQAVISVYNKEEDTFKASKAELEYLLHGLTNVFRGWIEMWLLVGNVATCAYDVSERRYCYASEFAEEEREACVQARHERMGAAFHKGMEMLSTRSHEGSGDFECRQAAQ